jgi:two-component system, LuxR family, response regulator FixJ
MTERKCVLIVENDDLLRSQIGQTLSDLDMTVFLASNGSAALKSMSEKFFDMVLADLDLPDLDGINVLAKARQLKINTPFILISQGTEKDRLIENIRQMMRLGASDFVEKPIKTENLVEAVRRVMDRDSSDKRMRLESLSLNQKHVIIIEMLLKGMGNKEIASALSISEQGIKYHIGRLLKRFSAKNRDDLRNKINLIRSA